MKPKPSVLAALGVILLVVAVLGALSLHGSSKSSPVGNYSAPGMPSASASGGHAARAKSRVNAPKLKAKTKPKSITHNTAPYAPGSSLAGGPAPKTAAQGVTLCSGPGHSAHDSVNYGNVQVFDNAWLGSLCIHAAPPGYFRITTALPQPGPDTVAAYPNVFTGTHYTTHTAGSLFPMPVTRLIASPFAPTAAWSPPTVPSFYLADYDLWAFNRGVNVHGHGNYEIVIDVNNIHSTSPEHLIDGHYWHEHTWLTCQRIAGGGCDTRKPEWPILLFSPNENLAHSQLRMGPFLALLVRQGYIPRTATVGSVHFGFECWTGCKGATASVHF